MTNSPESDHSPRWSPDAKQIAFISDRDSIDNLYLISVSGGEAYQLTASETKLHNPIWSNDGKYIICSSRILPGEKAEIENWTKDELPECEARTINHLLFRQWNRWLGDERNHVFLINVKDGLMKDLTPGDFDIPPVSLSSSHDFDISPDGNEICFVKNEDSVLAISTNHDIFIADIKSLKQKKITDNPALDSQPHYSPDGRYIAYVAMVKVGYESDRKCLVIYDRKKKKHIRLTDDLDRSVGQILWSPDSKQIFFTAREAGRCSIYNVDLKRNVKRITDDGFNIQIEITPDGKKLAFICSYNHVPNEIFTMPVTGGRVTQLTFTNSGLLEKLDLPKLEEFWFTGAEGSKVHSFILKPPG
ncbi:MAG: PD40 domain-containing protein, partial [Candidatus Marinimicrobia bacterium]|nr:PD40 domain-containing protein [Candidatus Neomarinimicrobiota bacterium]